MQRPNDSEEEHERLGRSKGLRESPPEPYEKHCESKLEHSKSEQCPPNDMVAASDLLLAAASCHKIESYCCDCWKNQPRPMFK